MDWTIVLLPQLPSRCQIRFFPASQFIATQWLPAGINTTEANSGNRISINMSLSLTNAPRLEVAFETQQGELSSWHSLDCRLASLPTDSSSLTPNELLDYAISHSDTSSSVASRSDFNIIHVRRNASSSPAFHSWHTRARIADVPFLFNPAPLNAANNTRRTKLVYFLNASLSASYLLILSKQLKLLRGAKVDSDPSFSFLLVFIGSPAEAEAAVDRIKKFLPSLFPHNSDCPNNRFRLICNAHSCYEYEGILATWAEARSAMAPSDLLIYAHCKGISKLDQARRRDVHEIASSQLLLSKIYANIDIMNVFPFLTRLGVATGGPGWMWFNFWMATSQYLANVERPILTTRRHYYEDWLYRQLTNPVPPERSTDAEQPGEPGACSYTGDVKGCYNALSIPGYFNIGDSIPPLDVLSAAELLTAKVLARHSRTRKQALLRDQC